MMRLQTIIAIAAVFVAGGSAQTRRSVQPPPGNAANAWMKVAAELPTAPDSLPAALRYQRDLLFDRQFGGPVLTPQNAQRAAVFEDHLGEGPEIPDVPDRAVLIATFTDHGSRLTASGRAAYTEITFHVSDVFQDASGHTAPGSDIVVIVPGGSVKAASGEIISYLTQPRPYFVEPSKTYLLVTQYIPEGDCYFVPKTWDLSDGVVRANDAVEVQRQHEGRSTLIGLTRDQLVRSLRTRLAR